MEVPGLAVGVVRLIVMSFDAYNRIADLRNQYKSLDLILQRYLKDINLECSLFTTAINVLLQSCEETKDVRAEMLANLQNERWKQELLSSRIRSALGDDFPVVFNAIDGAKDTIGSIEAKLLEVSHMETGSTTHMIMGEGVSMACKLRRRLGRRGKSKMIANDTMQQLETLRKALNGYNQSVQAVIFLRRETRTSSLDKAVLLPTSADTVSYNQDTQSAVARQTASRKLHSIVNRALRLSCQCHLLHICLDDLETLITEPVGSQETESSQFCFLLSCISDVACPHGLPTTQSRIPYFVFTARNDDTVSSPDGDVECIYEKLQVSGQQFEQSFCVSASNGNDSIEFVLRRASAVNAPSTAAPMTVSLDKLISPGSALLRNHLECFQIATKLVKTVLSFYASPWISDWTLETVQCFDKPDRYTREFFVPHIAVKFGDTRDIYSDNQEIRALGHMLLHLGRKERIENISGDHPRAVLMAALADLHSKMGLDFRHVVENLIMTWGSSNVDLMEEQNLVGFQSDIKKLEELVRILTPPKRY